MRDEQNSVRPGRIAGVGFNEAIAVVLDRAASISATTTGQPSGTAALHATAAFVRELGGNDPRVFTLYMHSEADNGSYDPSPGALAVISGAAGQWNDSAAADEVLSDMAIATLEDLVDVAREDAKRANSQVAGAVADAEQARAAVVEIEPLQDHIADLERAITAKDAELSEAHDQVAFLKAGYDGWVKATPKLTRSKATA